jgi:hypothetical protein
MLGQVRLITPLRELNRLPGMPAIGPLKRGLLRRQAGIPQGRQQGEQQRRSDPHFPLTATPT